MKQIKFVGATLVAVLMLLTSCLGESSNSGELYHIPGKIRFESGKLLIETYSGTFYTTQLSPYEYNEGDWVYIDLSYDMDSEENANAEANGYIYITLLANPVTVQRADISYRDTTQLAPNEIALTYAAVNVGYPQYFMLNGDLLMNSVFKEQTDIRYNFEIYYDNNQEPYQHDSRNTYTFYIRAIRTLEGKSPEIEYMVPNYYEVESILKSIDVKEQAAGKTEYNIAFRYINKIDTEKEEFTWTTQDPIRFLVNTEN
ncbi:hypothetical protein [Parabacteroides sp. PF5-6]|uniref:hypothetical protein n=1 Tax=Parabacteroides sp. PF5-6 TaxID=1742403 RepID=UPI0024050190|nr:hypothetical protein [Parabacteroides sp. PF5-6]